MSLDAHVRNAVRFGSMPIHPRYWGRVGQVSPPVAWGDRHDATLAHAKRAAESPGFIDRVKDRLGVNELPKGIIGDAEYCIVARATGSSFEYEWGEDDPLLCVLAFAFDNGLLPEYALDDDEADELRYGQEVD